MNSLVSISEAVQQIQAGRWLAVGGSATALAALPAGNWIGGTSHYFIGPDGGAKCDDKVFVTELGSLGAPQIACYGSGEIGRITSDAPERGFSLAITPAGSACLRAFAQRPYVEDLFMKPVVGWVAGVDLSAIGTSRAQVVDGRTRTFSEDALVVMHVELPQGKLATISIVNPFEKSDAHTLRFEEAGFSATHCVVNGQKRPLVDFLNETGYANGQLPLVGDFSGASINVSIQGIDAASGRVDFYAPVTPGVDYHLAKPLANYEQAFAKAIAERGDAKVTFSCNCILNYLFGQMEGRRTGEVQGPVTFGEIGYQLLNQTLVILDIV